MLGLQAYLSAIALIMEEYDVPVFCLLLLLALHFFCFSFQFQTIFPSCALRSFGFGVTVTSSISSKGKVWIYGCMLYLSLYLATVFLSCKITRLLPSTSTSIADMAEPNISISKSCDCDLLSLSLQLQLQTTLI